MLGAPSVRTYLEAAGVAALALSFAVHYWQHATSTARARERDEARRELRAAIDANASQTSALVTLEKANGQLLAVCASVDTARTLANETARFRASVGEASKRTWNAGSKDYASPKCAEVLALDLGAACPGIARGMLERAGRRAGADGTSSSSGRSTVTD